MTSARRRVVALGVLTGALARKDSVRYQSTPDPTRLRPGSWTDVLGLATELRVEPALWCAVHDARAGIPATVASRLHEIHIANTARNIRLRRALSEAVLALNGAGIMPLLLKGALQLVDGTPGGLDCRWMVDLDVAVPGEQLTIAGQTLEDLGYEANPGKPFLHPHEVPYIRDPSVGPIELHLTLGSPPIPSVLPIAEAWANSSEFCVGNARFRALSPTHQVLHNILHTAVQDLGHAVGDLPLRQLLTLSRLVKLHGPAIDWVETERRMEEHGLRTQLSDHLWLAHRFAGMPLPDGRWGVSPRLHEVRVLTSFALSWPPRVQRNLRFAFGRAYLDSLYPHGNRPLKLWGARVRHAVRLVGRDGRRVLRDVVANRT